MKIKVTVFFKGRRFKAESDDELNNMTEVEAVSDIFSAINYMAEDIYSMEPKEKRIQKAARWTVDYGDIAVLSSTEDSRGDGIAWSERIRMAVYAIIKAVYKDTDHDATRYLTNAMIDPCNPIYSPVCSLYIGLTNNVYDGIESFIDTILQLDILPEDHQKMLFNQHMLSKIQAELIKLESEKEEKNKKKGEI